MKALVLGAGASFGSSDHHRVKPPMVSAVLSSAARLGVLDTHRTDEWWEEFETELRESGGDPDKLREMYDFDEAPEHLSALKGFVKQQMMVPPERLASEPVDFEVVMGLVEGEVLGYHGLLQRRRARPDLPGPADVLEQQLYLVLCGTLVEATKGIQCRYHDEIAGWLDPGDTVISFNYDLLVDRSLESRGDWAKNDGYGLRFHRIGSRTGDDVEWRPPLDTESRVRLLKLHGSLNWLYPRDSWQQMNLDLYTGKPLRSSDVLYCLDELASDWERDHPLYEWWARYEHEEDDYIFDLHSLIVPPTLNKAYRNSEKFLGPLWGEALELMLTRVQELYFIGYSLRQQDLRSWWLFRKVASESQSLRRVVVVDPSDEVFERISRVFQGLNVERGERTLGEFADSR